MNDSSTPINIDPHDWGIAEALTTPLTNLARHVLDQDRWLTWGEHGWDDDLSAVELDNAVASLLKAALPEQDKPKAFEQVKERKRVTASLHRLLSSRGLHSMRELLTKQRPLLVHAHQLDTNPDVLGTPNGIVDLTTGELRPHDRSELITRRCSVTYDPAAACPRWQEFLREAISEDAEVQAYLQRALGYCLTGHTSAEQMWLLLGAGSNGKSTFLAVLQEMLGTYADASPESLLLTTKTPGAASNDIAAIRGHRVVTLADTDSGRALHEGRLKQLVSGDAIAARALYKEFTTFAPVAKFFLATNHLPKVQGTDDGIWRRLVLVKFPRQFPNNPHLRNELKAEMPGILAWAVRGAQAWFAEDRKLHVPTQFRNATNEFRHAEDHIARFVADCIVEDEGTQLSAQALRTAYENWCTDEGITARNRNEVAAELTAKGYSSRAYGKDRRHHWMGIKIASAPSPVQLALTPEPGAPSEAA